MSGPVLVWEHLAAGFVKPLDEFLASASDGYDASDFFEPLLLCNRWSGRFGDPLGDGPLLEIPVNCESYNLAYVPAVLERAGVDVPETWDQYFAAARAIVERTGGASAGFGQRGNDAWHTMYTGFATQLWSYGGSDFAEAAARSRRPRRSTRPRTSSPRSTTPARPTGRISAGTSSRSTSRAAATG